MFAQKITAILRCANPFTHCFISFAHCFRLVSQRYNAFAQRYMAISQCYKVFTHCFEAVKHWSNPLKISLIGFFVQNFHVNICLAEFRVFKTDRRVFDGNIFAAVLFGVINGQHDIFRDEDAVVARLIFKNG